MSPSLNTRFSASPSRVRTGSDRAPQAETSAPPATLSGRKPFPFSAEVDIAEMDARGRPGGAWAGRACELSRSQIVFRSRRMCYQGREVVLAVHLIDDQPVCLFGTIAKCDYDGDALYRTVVNLAKAPQTDAVSAWLTRLGSKG